MAIRAEYKVEMNDGQLRRLADVVDGKVQEFANVVLNRAREYAPVDTGNLKRTLSMRRVGINNAELRSNCGYGAYQELGTSKMAAQPYFAPAIRDAVNELSTSGEWV